MGLLLIAVSLWMAGCVSPTAPSKTFTEDQFTDTPSTASGSSSGSSQPDAPSEEPPSDSGDDAPSEDPPSDDSGDDTPSEDLPPSDGGKPGEASASGSILIDASREGGVWWFPQWEGTGFYADQPHQGQPLAEYLRSRGFKVDELPRGVTITDTLLDKYTWVIRAGDYGRYTEAELSAYERFLSRPVTFMLISEFHRDGRDQLAERLGLQLSGWVDGEVSQFSDHLITRGMGPLPYIAGAVVGNAAANPDIEILGWLATGQPVMGILKHPTAKIFFLGELNGIEGVPQPFVDNLIDWALR
jgi:hypothetical protein